MSKDAFHEIEHILQSGKAEEAFDFLAQRFREEKDYPMLFEALMMRKRHELGLPLIQSGDFSELPEPTRRDYEEGTMEAAREVGSLYLAAGDVPQAWPYFRAIGESGPVAEAIERVEPKEGIDAVIEIAFYERVNPRKGFELILAVHGLCRAITASSQYPVAAGREECAGLLFRTLQGDLVNSIKRVIGKREGSAPETESLTELMEGRDWLFAGNNYFIDSTHVASVVQHSVELTDPETLTIALELTEYGRRLGAMFQFPGQPPFQDLYVDHGIYLRALLGEDADTAVAHFRAKLTEADPNDPTNTPAQVLIKLLVRLRRFAEAIEVAREYLDGIPLTHLSCPPVEQLCQMAGDFSQLGKLSREKGDLLNFAAARLQT